MTDHQLKQLKVIDELERQIKSNSLTFSTVTPVQDFDNDPRICLSSVHIPSQKLKEKIYNEIMTPLQRMLPEQHYYYSSSQLHMTIKSVRVINDPPHFTDNDIQKAKEVFSRTIPKHKKFNVYFFRLLLFPGNLALMGTTDPELDNIILDLDTSLKQAGVLDDKKYVNPKYFFCNMTLSRFTKPVSEEFKNKVEKLSNNLSFEPYNVNSVTLGTYNSVFKKRNDIATWELQ